MQSPGRPPRPSWLYSLIAVLSWPFLKLLFRLRASGVENLPREGGYVLAANHWSNFDPWPLGIPMFPRRFLRFMKLRAEAIDGEMSLRSAPAAAPRRSSSPG